MARAQTITGGRDATVAVIPGRYALSVGWPNLPAPEGWSWTPLSSVARLESGHTPSRRRPEYWGGPIPWVGIRDATGNHGRVIHETLESTNELGIENSSARVLPKNTVCLSRTASVGYVVVMGRPMSTSQDFVNWICSEELNPHFLKYVLLAEREALLMFAVGSVHQTIYFPEAKAFHICMPDRITQDSVVEVLGALDDKIELNRRMSETLEATARAIFSDWFVDFGPTRAKMAMRGEDQHRNNIDRSPYLAADIWSLFPDTLDEDGKPEGWSAGALSDVASLNPESWSRAMYPEAVDYVDLSNTKWGSIEATTPYAREAAPSRAQRILRPGDTIVGTVRPGNGSYAYVSAQGLTGSTGFAVLRPKDQIFREVVYFAVTAKENIDRLARLADGGAYPAVRPELVTATELVVAPGSLFAAFSSTTRALLDRAEANKRETNTLAATRDFLLPKLMSGEVRIRDAEKLVGEVT
ncbi:restriction endonuclease subunit S [Mesorhizobium sp. M0800]|uniref:restriction endonuclease subunit S n=1 Tax=Mesorhizobium sp. M0800 TaxID=2957000 RepID=UPI00333AD3AE